MESEIVSEETTDEMGIEASGMAATFELCSYLLTTDEVIWTFASLGPRLCFWERRLC